MCLGVPANERVVLFFINQFIYLMFNYLWLLFQLRVVDPQRLAHNGLSGFYDVRMRRAARLKSLVSGRSALRRDSGCKPRWSRPLSATSSTVLYCVPHDVQTEVSDGVGGNWRGISTITGKTGEQLKHIFVCWSLSWRLALTAVTL